MQIQVVFPESFKFELQVAYLDQFPLKPGDDVCVNEFSDSESIAKVRSLYFDCVKGKVIVSVQWYYKPKDVSDKKVLKKCSKIELFLSDSTLEIEICCIDGKVRVCTLDEILEMKEPEEDVFFMRAKWSEMEKKFDPPIRCWKRGCVCDKVINPDKPFTVCTGCRSFLHIGCLAEVGEQMCPMCGEGLKRT